MDMQNFFESVAGQITVTAIIVILFAVILCKGKGQKADTRAVAVSALLVALSIILNQLVLFRMPQGGSITLFSMVPIVLCAYFFGVRRGLMAGMCVGLINLIFNPYVIHPIQLLLDYPLAFWCTGTGRDIRRTEARTDKGIHIRRDLQIYMCSTVRCYILRRVCSGRLQCADMVAVVQCHISGS